MRLERNTMTNTEIRTKEQMIEIIVKNNKAVRNEALDKVAFRFSTLHPGHRITVREVLDAIAQVRAEYSQNI